MSFSPLARVNFLDDFSKYFKGIIHSCIQFMSAPESIKATSIRENSLLITKVISVCHF